MSKKVVLVGHCGPDSSYLRMAVSKAIAGATVLMADDDATLGKLVGGGVDLLLFNRQLEFGFSKETGVELIRELRPKFPELKMMLVSNFPEAQQEAIREGALPGFGKREIGSARVADVLKAAFVEEPAVEVRSTQR